MARLTPLDVDDLPQELEASAQNYLKTMGGVPASFRTMARKPAFAQAYGALQKAIGSTLTIPTELRSMMFLIQSQNNGCLYCQAHSVSALVKNPEVAPEKIDALWEFETHPVFNDAERAALALALAASSMPNAATDEHFDNLKLHFNEDQIVELVACLSIGAFLNTWNDTLATQIEDASAETAEATLGSRGWSRGKHA